MGLEEVKKGLENELKQRQIAILREAQEEKKVVLEKTKKELDTYRKQISKETEDSVSMLERGEISSAHLRAKKELLGVKKEMIDKVFKSVEEELVSLPTDKKRKIIKNLIAQASKEIKVDVVYCNSADKKLISGFKTRSEPISGGVICETQDGRSRVDLTYPTILQELRDKNLKEIATKLFD